MRPAVLLKVSFSRTA